MMIADWLVVGYVGFNKHEVRLSAEDYYTRDSAVKAASCIMLYDDGFDVEEDYGLALIVDVQLVRDQP